MQIPNWKAVLDVITRAQELIPGVRLIGWDVAITPDGAVLIEGNEDANNETLEFVGDPIGFYPLLKSEVHK